MNEDKATRYHRLRRRTVILAAAWRVALLAGLLLTGLSHHLRDAALTLAGACPAALQLMVTVCAWVTAVVLAHDIGAMPLAFYGGHLLDRRYGLSRQPAAAWFRDYLGACGINLLFAVVAAEWIYASLARWPEGWWLAAWGGAVAAGVAVAWAAPILLLPLFFRVVPLEDEGLRQRLLALAAKIRVPAIGVYEWRVSDRTPRANAALTGIGGTRRILLSDTLIADYQPDEVEAILAHELAHHAHHDIWRTLLVNGLVAGAALLAADAALRIVIAPAGLRGIADVAGMPALALAAIAVAWIASPLVNAVSRSLERRADRHALEATNNVDAFITAMRRLGTRNLAEDAPTLLARLFFHTHPPIGDRIASARGWAEETGRAPRGHDREPGAQG